MWIPVAGGAADDADRQHMIVFAHRDDLELKLLRAWGLGFRVQGSGLGFRVLLGLQEGVKIQGLG